MSILAIVPFLMLSGMADRQSMIEGICASRHLPALGVAIVRLGREPEVYVTGVRTAGGRDRVQVGDTWHLGSDTKAFTAALVAYYIDKHKGAYSDRIAGLLNVSKPDPAYAQKTVADLLDMMGNLAHDPDKGWFYYQGLGGNGSQRRQAAAEDVLTTAPHGIKLGQFNYSNTGYTLLGHIAEDWAYMPYEDALTAKILKPLRITSGGFGPNPPGEPQPHVDGKPVTSGVLDNPAVMTPAGRLRISLGDWSLWIEQVMLSVRGEHSLLADSYGARIRSAEADNTYVNGWIKMRRGWSRGPVLTHAGTNTLNYSVAWVAPAEGVAYLAVTNDGGANAAPALDEAVSGLIRGQ